MLPPVILVIIPILTRGAIGYAPPVILVIIQTRGAIGYAPPVILVIIQTRGAIRYAPPVILVIIQTRGAIGYAPPVILVIMQTRGAIGYAPPSDPSYYAYTDLKTDIERGSKTYCKMVSRLSRDDRIVELNKVQDLFKKAMENTENKVQIAMQMYEMVRD